MGFKLGRRRSNYASGGVIKNKMRFGQQAGSDGSVPGTPVIRKPLDEGIMGEANMDGSIFISDKIVPGRKYIAVCEPRKVNKKRERVFK